MAQNRGLSLTERLAFGRLVLDHMRRIDPAFRAVEAGVKQRLANAVKLAAIGKSKQRKGGFRP
jgi:hypothetical protein